MGVRKIPILTQSVGSKVQLPGQTGHVRTESALETNFVLLMGFDTQVERVESQPVTVPYNDPQGKAHTYTPDFLVRYFSDPVTKEPRAPLLAEVKPAAILERKRDEFAPRFSAARAYAQVRGWTFAVYTERDILSPYLDNARFLMPYIWQPAWHEATAWEIRDALKRLGETTPRGLLVTLAPDDEAGQLRYLPFVWQLVAYRYIGADLQRPLTMTSTLRWLPHAPYRLRPEWIHDRDR